MSNRQKLIADFLFAVQIVGAFVLCGSQFFRFLHTTEGQLLSMFLVMEAYLGLHFMLASAAHRTQPSRVTQQAVWTYLMWIVLIGSNIVAIFINGGYEWSSNDTWTTILALSGAGVVFAGAKAWGIGFQDPMPKSLLAMLFKALPQFIMMFEVIDKGGAGVPLAAVVAGNITILIRVGQIWFTIRETGWDRNRLWLFASEIVNELSWASVSIAWAVWFVNL